MLFAQALLDPTFRSRLLMPEIGPNLYRRVHPGFLGFELPKAAATSLCELFWALGPGIRGRIVLARHREASVTNEQAEQIARNHPGCSVTTLGNTHDYAPPLRT